MKKLIIFILLFIPTVCFAASGVLTSQGNVRGIPISEGQRWEVSCNSSKERIELKNLSNGDVIVFENKGGMVVNGALSYTAYYNGEKKLFNVWIYIRIDGDDVSDLSIKTHYGTTYFK